MSMLPLVFDVYVNVLGFDDSSGCYGELKDRIRKLQFILLFPKADHEPLPSCVVLNVRKEVLMSVNG